jgi:hypothetical protein
VNRIGFTYATVRRANVAPARLFTSVTYPKERVRLDGDRKIYERDADSGYRIRFHFCPSCGTTLYWEGDRNPAVCGVAVGAFDASAFPPPSDSIWEESMYPWLGLPASTEHHQQSRPPVTNQTTK